MVLISPYSRRLRNGRDNPKNYPRWAEVVQALAQRDIAVCQIGVAEEPEVPGVAGRLSGLRLKVLAEHVKTCQAWASVDNFFHHFAHYLGKPGVVVFGQQDPEMFGHPGNVNLLKHRKFVRPHPWNWWEDTPADDECWVEPDAVVAAIADMARKGIR